MRQCKGLRLATDKIDSENLYAFNQVLTKIKNASQDLRLSRRLD